MENGNLIKCEIPGDELSVSVQHHLHAVSEALYFPTLLMTPSGSKRGAIRDFSWRLDEISGDRSPRASRRR